jgi:hypothetical protein
MQSFLPFGMFVSHSGYYTCGNVVLSYVPVKEKVLSRLKNDSGWQNVKTYSDNCGPFQEVCLLSAVMKKAD